MTQQEKEQYQENLRLIRSTLDGAQFDFGLLAKFFLLFGIASLLERTLTLSLMSLDKTIVINLRNVFGIVKVLLIVAGYVFIRYKIVATKSAHTLQLYRLWGFGIFIPWILNILYHLIKGIFGDAYAFPNDATHITLLVIEFFGLFVFTAVFLCMALMTSNRNMLCGSIFAIFLIFAVIFWILNVPVYPESNLASYEYFAVVKLYNLLYTVFDLLTSSICIVIGITFQLKRKKR